MTLVFSCENNNNDGVPGSPEMGWIQFLETNPDVYSAFKGIDPNIEIYVNIQVPTTTSDLTINYDLVSVSGANPNNFFENSIIVPAGKTSYSGPDNSTGFDYGYLAKIDFDVDKVSLSDLLEPMVFDVVLTGTSSSQITAGFENYPVSQRVVIYSASSLEGTYSVNEQFIAGANAPFGLSDFFGESYQVELALLPGDETGRKMIVNNSAGYDTYFIPDTEVTFELDGRVTFDDGYSTEGYPVVALFNIHEIENSSYSYDGTTFTLSCDGPLATFGDYRFILTKI